MNRVAASGLLAVLAATGAQAADLPRRAAPPVVAPVPTFTWTGAYFGANVAGLVDGNFLLRSLAPLPGAASRPSAGGFVAGGTVGYNYQFAPENGFVAGLEGDIGYSGVRHTGIIAAAGLGTANGRLQTDTYHATIRGRIGYAWGPVLVYATGGWAFTEFNAEGVAATQRFGLGAGRPFVGAFAGPVRRSIPLDGYTVGGGVAYKITPDWSLKAEYLFAELDRRVAFRAGGTPVRARVGLDAHLMRIGADYRFSLF
ncbi:porin [Methylobacterium sp. 4-46]|uniref:outer membrane protein n=1 Tax=unclassified Methylobacterium TaxID=2615210 RepID=UPI000152D880|nr:MULTISPECIES: outer membrane beta-barrel protein [Methylobacterium]ACA17570.1 porin [Methylobacterium sp. 4-46]WFT83247.1 outer membrane beta-barrel protein [Methylobacterium nodulans]